MRCGQACLGALAVLSSDDRNLKVMRNDKLDELLMRSANDKDERIQMFVSQLEERLREPGGG